MKKHSLYILAAGLLLSNVALTSCDDDDVAGANNVLAVKSVLPTKVMEGQVVTITGTGLEKATAVVFPGDVKVTDINKVGNGYITVVTPAGVAADGGSVAVEADGETAYSAYELTLGAPEPVRVAPLDAEVKINECVEVYGTDLEFISKAYFPGADGNDIVVDAKGFKRRSTSALFIYTPDGISYGPGVVTLEDCSGKKYVLPEVVFGETEKEWDRVIWNAGYDGSWTFLELRPSDFNFEDHGPVLDQRLKFVFEGTQDDSRFCICLGDGWSAPNIGGEGDVNNISIAGKTEFIWTIDDAFLTELTSGIMRIGGVNFRLVRIELLEPPVPLWQGEHETGWWWYLPASELDFTDSVVEVGKKFKFTFKDHENAQTFCVCDGNWGTPDLGGSPDINNVAIPGGVNECIFDVTEGCVNAIQNAENAFILGGEVVILKIEVID